VNSQKEVPQEQKVTVGLKNRKLRTMHYVIRLIKGSKFEQSSIVDKINLNTEKITSSSMLPQPQGYLLPLNCLPSSSSNTILDPTTANGMGTSDDSDSSVFLGNW
jgi:hypothetical protein